MIRREKENQGNDYAGISILDSPDNIIGGSDENERNIISGNITGISISGDAATGNRIEGNYIGTNAGGTKGIGNDNGIYINAPGNFIGGSTPGTGNLISGNGGPGGGDCNRTGSWCRWQHYSGKSDRNRPIQVLMQYLITLVQR